MQRDTNGVPLFEWPGNGRTDVRSWIRSQFKRSGDDVREAWSRRRRTPVGVESFPPQSFPPPTTRGWFLDRSHVRVSWPRRGWSPRPTWDASR